MTLLSNSTSKNIKFPENLGYVTPSGNRALGVVGEVQLLDADNEIISTLGGGGGVGGGNNTYSNASGDFTATITDSTTNITITGLPFTLEDIHVVAGSIKKIDSSGNVTSLGLKQVTVSGGVITLADEDDFVTGDTVLVTLIGPDKAYDNTLDNQLVSIQNPNYEHYTSVEQITEADLGLTGTATGTDADTLADSGASWTAANVAVGYEAYNGTEAAAATVNSIGSTTSLETDAVTDWTGDTYYVPEVARYEIPSESYNLLSIHYRLVAGDANNSLIMKLYASNDSDASTSSDNYWVDITNDVFGSATLEADGIAGAGAVSTEGIGFIDTPSVVLKYMIKLVGETQAAANNDVDIYIKKGY